MFSIGLVEFFLTGHANYEKVKTNAIRIFCNVII